jgi:hypothetical protein
MDHLAIGPFLLGKEDQPSPEGDFHRAWSPPRD